MDVSARWVIIDGERKVRITVPDGQGLVLDEAVAWQLVHETEAALLTKPRA